MNRNHLNNKTQGVDVDKLLANAEGKVSSPIMKQAIAEARQQKEEQQKAAIIGFIGEVQENTASVVAMLRKVRAEEKKTKSLVEAVALAEENFYKDADINAYNKAKNEAYRNFNTSSRV